MVCGSPMIKEIGLHLQILLTTSRLIMNTIGRTYNQQATICKRALFYYYLAHMANFGWLSNQDQTWLNLETTLEYKHT